MKKKHFYVTLLGICVFIGTLFVKYVRDMNQILRKTEEDDSKIREFYFLLLNWIHIKNQGDEIGDYLKECGYSSVAVYGVKELGKELINELNRTDIDVKCAIDKDIYASVKDVKVVTPEDDIPNVDLIIVTATHYFDEIIDQLETKVDCPILAFDDLIWEMSRRYG